MVWIYATNTMCDSLTVAGSWLSDSSLCAGCEMTHTLTMSQPPIISSASDSNKDECVCRHQLALISVINCLLGFGKQYEPYSNLFRQN